MVKNRGFTIVELAVIILVLAILVTVSGLAWRNARDNARNLAMQNNVALIKDAIDKYYDDNGEYPLPSGCAYNAADARRCSNGELASILVPDYLESLPKDNSDAHFEYAAERKNSSLEDRYAIRVPNGASYCKSGKNMKTGWWSSAPECNF
ncbi:hypothetical protein CR969_02510 [Candidatus Saccharibacteria bacterium]|nr:MAG: hypothetical protein CR969_02510 [Candidatus Saccharibacteria bacterium]